MTIRNLVIGLLVIATLLQISNVVGQEYSQGEATRCGLLSYAAYCAKTIDVNWTCYWCQQIPGFSLTGSFGVADSGEDFVVHIDGRNFRF